MSNYAVMFFSTELELGISDKPEQWVNTDIYYTDNGAKALYKYANTPNPASQLIVAEDEYELKSKIGEMILNFQDKEWLDENLYPYL
jgi:hypothetical protein